VARTGSGNKALLWVLGGVGACLVLVLLVCAGVGYMMMRQMSRAVDQVAKTTEAPRFEPPKAVAAPPVEAPRPKEVVVQPKVELPEIKLPTFKDLDDALKKLDPKEPQLVRLAALKYIANQKPPADAAKKKAVVDALNALKDDKDELVRGAAELAKIPWEFD
jgi:hypothetical protein